MKTFYTRRLALFVVLTALPVLLAWYIAAKRSWLPKVHKIFLHEVTELRYAPDGKTLICVGRDHTSRESSVWHAYDVAVASLHPQRQLARVVSYGAPTFAPDFKTFARVYDPVAQTLDGAQAMHDGCFEVCESSGSKTLASFGEQFAFKAVFSPDGRLVVTPLLSQVFVWSAQKRLGFERWETGSFERWESGSLDNDVEAVAFSKESRWLAAYLDTDEMCLWDVASGKMLRNFGTPTRTQHQGNLGLPSLAFAPNGRILASSNGGTLLCLWNPTTGSLLHTFQNGKGQVRCLAFASDNRTLASGDDSGTITLWNVSTGSKLRILTLAYKGVTTLAWSPDGSSLIGGYDDGTVARWRVK